MSPRRNVWVMSFTVLLTITAIYSWHRVLANLLRDLGADVGLAFMILTLANRLPSVFGGLLADRVGRKRMLVVGTILMAPMYALAAFMHSWTGIIVALGLCWFFGAFLGPSIPTIVSESVPEERRGRALGILETFIMAAVCIGPWVGSRIIESVGDFRKAMHWMLLGTSLVYFVVAAIRAIFLVETRGTSSSFSVRGTSLGPVAILLPVGCLVYATWFLTTDGPFFALYSKDVIRLQESHINYAAFLGGLAAIVGAMTGGWLSDRLGSPRVLVASFFAMFAMLAPFAWAWWRKEAVKPGLDYAILVLLFIPAEIFTVAFQKHLTSSAPKERRALLVGIVGTVTGIFAALANLFGGRLYTGQGPVAPLAIAAACAAAGTVVAVFLLKRPPAPAPV